MSVGSSSWRAAVLAAAGLALGGCQAPRYAAVVSQAITDGAVSVWVPDGTLRTGNNPLVVDVTGPAAARVRRPPRLEFEKPVSVSGYARRLEVKLRPDGPGRFSGEAEFPEPGQWIGRLEVDGEAVAIEVSVE